MMAWHDDDDDDDDDGFAQIVSISFVWQILWESGVFKGQKELSLQM